MQNSTCVTMDTYVVIVYDIHGNETPQFRTVVTSYKERQGLGSQNAAQGLHLTCNILFKKKANKAKHFYKDFPKAGKQVHWYSLY